MRLNLYRCAVEFFLFRIGSGKIGGGGRIESTASQKSYAGRSFVAAFNGLDCTRNCRANFDRNIFGVVNLFHGVLLDFAWSFGVQRKEVNLWNISVSVRL